MKSKRMAASAIGMAAGMLLSSCGQTGTVSGAPVGVTRFRLSRFCRSFASLFILNQTKFSDVLKECQTLRVRPRPHSNEGTYPWADFSECTQTQACILSPREQYKGDCCFGRHPKQTKLSGAYWQKLWRYQAWNCTGTSYYPTTYIFSSPPKERVYRDACNIFWAIPQKKSANS